MYEEKMKKDIIENPEAEVSLQELLASGLVLVVLGVAMAIGASVQTGVRSDFTANSIEYNLSTNALQGQENLTKKLPLYGTVLGSIAVLFLVIRVIYVRMMK